MQQPSLVWREGDEELHEKVNETIRRHLLWSRRVNWEGVQSGLSTKPKKTLLKKSVLPATKFGNLKEYGCVICSLELQRSTVSCLYPCLHRFCYGCILKWLKVKQSCPLCLVTPEKLLFSIQSSVLFKETDLELESPNSFKRAENNDLERQEGEFTQRSQDTGTVRQQILRGTRRQREFTLQRENRFKITRKTRV